MLTVVFADATGSIVADERCHAARPRRRPARLRAPARLARGSAAGSAAGRLRRRAAVGDRAAPTGSATPVAEGALKPHCADATPKRRHAQRDESTSRGTDELAAGQREQSEIAVIRSAAMTRVALALRPRVAACSSGSKRVGSQPSWRGSGTSSVGRRRSRSRRRASPRSRYNEPLQAAAAVAARRRA